MTFATKTTKIVDFPFTDETAMYVELTQLWADKYIEYVRNFWKHTPARQSMEVFKAQLLATSGVQMTFTIFREIFWECYLSDIVEAIIDIIKK